MKRKKNFCCTLLIIVLILSIGIGYAYLSSELNFEVATASISPYIRLCKRATHFILRHVQVLVQWDIVLLVVHPLLMDK